MAADAIPLGTGAAAGVALNATVKYNPHLWGPEELRSIFVVRTRELQELLDRLHATPNASVPQHLLITGARGMGKTTLLRRLALAVEDDPELAKRWVPVTFPEEQYTVSTLAELWRNVLDALADTRERQGASTEELGRLDAEIRCIGDLPAEARESAALESLGAWIRSNGRRLLLLIDSTDLLLSNLAGTAEPGAPRAAKGKNTGQGTKAAKVDGGATPLWRLRSTLSHDPGIFWLGASYQSLETEHAYQDAFWDFFELLELRPLQVAEMREAMLALARTFGAGRGLTAEDGEREMAHNLDARPERLKALRAITGGNPRTTVMLYELFAAGGPDDVHSDLRRLLDTMTPLYKARMEALSDQARKLLAHLMEHWAPISARDLGQVSGIATNTVSGQLGRLEAEGLVEKATLAGTKRAGYQASERLFNVWYLMRYASRRLRQRLTWLVEFMGLWYSGDELTELARQRAGQYGQGRVCRSEQLEFSRALSLALPDGHADHYCQDWAAYRRAAELDPSDPYSAANLARLLAALGRHSEASTSYRQAVALAQAADVQGAGTETPPVNRGLGHAHLLLQAHLWLGNRDLALQTLDRLTQAAAAGDRDAFDRLKEQARECQHIGLGPSLKELMGASAWADFLQPFALALGAAAVDVTGDALAGASPELRTLAEEVLAELRPAPSAAGGTSAQFGPRS